MPAHGTTAAQPSDATVVATVVVLTYNAGPLIRDVLAAISTQQTAFRWELLVIDSGSMDRTTSIVREHAARHEPTTRLVEIPNADFGHGRTRNMAAQLAGGEFVVFLTHDAIPAGTGWLDAMVHPFRLSDRVACVYGKQIPRPRCCPAVKRDVISYFSRMGPAHAISVQESNGALTDPADRDIAYFFSDVNSAVRRSVLTGAIPFPEVAYAEDQAFARDVLDAGLLKVYTPFGAVYHSHDYRLVRYFRRMYDEFSGLRASTGKSADTPLWIHVATVGKETLEDWRFIAMDRSYTGLEKLRWIVAAPLYNAARRTAIRLASRDRLPAWVRRRSTLDRSRPERDGPR